MNPRIFRISGLSLLSGALVFILHTILRSMITAGPEAATFALDRMWVPVNILGVVGAILVLLGLPAMYAHTSARFGTAGLIGIVLLAVAWMFIALFLSLYSALIVPWLADKAPALIDTAAPLPSAFIIAFALGLLAWLAGSVLLALPFVRHRLQPAWVGYALILSAIWMLIGDIVIAPSGPASSLALNLLSNMGPVILLVGVAYLGYHMFAEQRPAAPSI